MWGRGNTQCSCGVGAIHSLHVGWGQYTVFMWGRGNTQSSCGVGATYSVHWGRGNTQCSCGVGVIHTSTAILVHWNFNKKRISTKSMCCGQDNSIGDFSFMFVRFNSVFVPMCSPKMLSIQMLLHFSQIAPRVCTLVLFIYVYIIKATLYNPLFPIVLYAHVFHVYSK